MVRSGRGQSPRRARRARTGAARVSVDVFGHETRLGRARATGGPEIVRRVSTARRGAAPERPPRTPPLPQILPGPTTTLTTISTARTRGTTRSTGEAGRGGGRCGTVCFGCDRFRPPAMRGMMDETVGDRELGGWKLVATGAGRARLRAVAVVPTRPSTARTFGHPARPVATPHIPPPPQRHVESRPARADRALGPKSAHAAGRYRPLCPKLVPKLCSRQPAAGR